MIYSFTANLAIDLFVETDKLEPFAVNRTNYTELTANGKGVNFSLILQKLGIESIVTGFKAGFTGDFIEKDIKSYGLETFFPEVDGLTRINIFTKVVSENLEYKQVNPGPNISESAKQKYIEFLSENLKNNDILSINGSFPNGIDESYIEKICKISQEKHVKLIIDNSSKFVKNMCKYSPYLLKPNENELCSWFDEEVDDINQFIRLSKKLLNLGAQNVLVSLGGDGAIFVNKEIIIYCNAPKGKVVNTAMAGDALLATFVGELIKNASKEDALKKAVAAGSSTAFRENLTEFDDVDELMKGIEVKYLTGGDNEI